MDISVKCPHEDCGVSFSVGEHYAGKKTRCPECNAVVEVPSVPSPGAASPTPASAGRKRGVEALVLGIVLLAVVASVAYFAGSMLERTDSLSRETAACKARIGELEAEMKTLKSERDSLALKLLKLKDTSSHFRKLSGELSQRYREEEKARVETEARLEKLARAEEEARNQGKALLAKNKSAKTAFDKKEAAWEELLQSEKALREKYEIAFREEREFPTPGKAPAAEVIKALDKKTPPVILKGLPIYDLRRLMADYAADKTIADKRHRATRAVVVANTLGVGRTAKGMVYVVMVPRDMRRATPGRAYLLPGTEKDVADLKPGSKFIAVGWIRGSFSKTIYLTDCQRVKTDYIMREIQRRKIAQKNAADRKTFDAIETLILRK